MVDAEEAAGPDGSLANAVAKEGQGQYRLRRLGKSGAAVCCYDRGREWCRNEGGNCSHARAKLRSKEAPREAGNSILAAPRPTGDPLRDRCSSGLGGILHDAYGQRLFSSDHLSNAALFLLDCTQWVVRGLRPRNSSDSPFDVRNQVLFHCAATQFGVSNE